MRDGGGRSVRVWTIPPGAPFLDALAAGLLARYGGEQDRLPSALVLLPNRRGCRSMAEAFLQQSAGRPTLLPRIAPLGDVDEDELALGSGDDDLAADLSLPPAIAPLRRQLLLSRLIMAQRSRSTSFDQAARLAGELARLIDQAHTESVDLGRLSELVPERLAEHWQRTVDFLAIVSEHWPRILTEEGCIDAADRRNRLLRLQAQRWRALDPQQPVVAAGSTGSMPATAELLAAIAGLSDGVIVLPGLDRDADDDTWLALEPTHPQYGMARLLARIGVVRQDVQTWPTSATGVTGPKRSALINLALRPAATAARRPDAALAASALEAVVRIDAPTPEEEARVVALIMRETLETAGKTAALVTPDRGLARRTAAELKRWAVEVDDSGGQPLAQTPPSVLLRLTARVAIEDYAPVPLLSALKHPLAAGGRSPAAFRSDVRVLERSLLRGPRPAPGVPGLLAALAEAEKSRSRELENDVEERRSAAQKDGERFARLRGLITDLETVMAPLDDALAQGRQPLASLLAAHIETMERLTATDTVAGPARLWRGEAGEALAHFVAEAHDAAAGLPPLSASAYPALLDALLQGRVVRPRYGRHPRLSIWGPLEARMQRADVLILGGLNEDTWPPKVHPSPWMSRPMMTDLGLSLPERRIGLSAHDFAEGFAAPEVFLTRATRVEGVPTVASRWLLRLENLVGGPDMAHPHARGAKWLEWQHALDAAATPRPAEPPAPCPPVAARPRRLSVTWIERWMRDPYAVYARYVLGLKALNALDADPGAADYGSFVHRALDLFLRENPGVLPPDALDRLLAVGRRTIGAAQKRAGVRAFWWPRFERIAGWFVDNERERRALTASTVTEAPGQVSLPAPEGPFVLTAKADRIDILAGGDLAVIDYKTGAIPSEKEIAAGFAPQLPLEAAMAAAGGFAAAPRAAVGRLEYWRLTGGRPPAEIRALNADAQRLAEQALDGLQALIARFDLAQTPYPSRPRPSVAPRYSDYEHLARVREWTALAADDAD